MEIKIPTPEYPVPKPVLSESKIKYKWLLYLSAAVYILALLSPNNPAVISNARFGGLAILLFGWAGIMAINFAWFSNVLAVVCLTQVLRKHYHSSWKWGLWMLLLSLQSFQGVPRVDSPGSEGVVRYTSFYFWELSLISLFLVAWLNYRKEKIQG